MSDDKPEFDPTQPFETQAMPEKPAFDPSQPFESAPSELESFARGAGNNFPLAPQAIAAGESLVGDKSYSEDLSDWNEKAKEAKAANPVAYGTGAVTGAAAPLLIPGVGEALEAEPLLGNAALGAANAISNEDLVKNPGQAAKEAVEGAGIGGVTGAALDKVMPAPEMLKNFATKEAVKSAGIASALLGKLEPEERQALGQFIQENGLVNVDKQEALKAAQDLEEKIGSKIGEIGEKSKDLGLGADPQGHLNAALALDQKANELGALRNPEARKLARAYASGRDDVLGLGQEPGWDTIQNLKKQYGKIAFDSTGAIKNQANADTYFALSDMLKGIAQKAQANPELAQEYKDALGGYHKIQPVIKGLTKLVGQEEAGGTAGGGMGIARIIRQLPGQKNPAINLPTAAAVGALGHPLMGVMAALPTLANPAVRANTATAMARGLPAGRQAITQELIDFLESKYGRRQ